MKDQAPLLPGKEFFDIPDEIFFKFKNDVFLGKKVVVKKTLLKKGTYTEKDFRIKRVSKFLQSKQAILNGIRNRIAGVAVSTSFFEIYEFITATGMLASQGVFLTDENREKTYLNIINTGDEALINALERYLEIKDNMDQLFRQYHNAAETLKRVEETTTIEELEAVREVWKT
jgi:hypothetical protein